MPTRCPADSRSHWMISAQLLKSPFLTIKYRTLSASIAYSYTLPAIANTASESMAASEPNPSVHADTRA